MTLPLPLPPPLPPSLSSWTTLPLLQPKWLTSRQCHWLTTPSWLSPRSSLRNWVASTVPRFPIQRNGRLSLLPGVFTAPAPPDDQRREASLRSIPASTGSFPGLSPHEAAAPFSLFVQQQLRRLPQHQWLRPWFTWSPPPLHSSVSPPATIPGRSLPYQPDGGTLCPWFNGPNPSAPYYLQCGTTPNVGRSGDVFPPPPPPHLPAFCSGLWGHRNGSVPPQRVLLAGILRGAHQNATQRVAQPHWFLPTNPTQPRTATLIPGHVPPPPQWPSSSPPQWPSSSAKSHLSHPNHPTKQKK